MLRLDPEVSFPPALALQVQSAAGVESKEDPKRPRVQQALISSRRLGSGGPMRGARNCHALAASPSAERPGLENRELR